MEGASRTLPTDVREEQVFGKSDTVMYLRNRKNEIRKTSIFGDNINRCVEKFGTESETWLGKTVMLSVQESLDGKKFLIIVPN